MSDQPQPDPPFPNLLREIREKRKMMTREGLRSICVALAESSPALYSAVSLSTMRLLEVGTNLPRLKTASTLAKALEVDPAELFPLGTENPTKNPAGNTTITKGRKKGGRPKR